MHGIMASQSVRAAFSRYSLDRLIVCNHNYCAEAVMIMIITRLQNHANAYIHMYICVCVHIGDSITEFDNALYRTITVFLDLRNALFKVTMSFQNLRKSWLTEISRRDLMQARL